MFERLSVIEERFAELESKLGEAGATANSREYARLAREHAQLEPLISRAREYRRLSEDISQHKTLLEDKDRELRDLARQELPALLARQAELETELKHLLAPQDPNDQRNVILEVRAGTGGEEASLFAAELLRMYTRYAEEHGWRFELLSASTTGLGGIKEAVASINGRGAYSRLKFEGGVHRVQRVPATEASGRIHTSAVTVAVLPEADEVEVHINEDKDLRIDVMRASGPGGQSVNTTDSAVRVTHLPTGIVIVCRDEKSQHKNKARALKILRARLLERARQEQEMRIAQSRRSMVGSGDRSERIRTYNFPQSRVTDHRVNLTLHQLDRVLDGQLDPIIDALAAREQAEALSA
jgi:peptide chain release factor 1